MFTLFRTLLVIAHFLYSLYVMIYYACITVYRKYTEVWGKTSSITGLETLARTIARNRKIPTHLVIVFGLRRVSLLDCVHIIGWCITVGIPYISFFDYNGKTIVLPHTYLFLQIYEKKNHQRFMYVWIMTVIVISLIEKFFAILNGISWGNYTSW